MKTKFTILSKLKPSFKGWVCTIVILFFSPFVGVFINHALKIDVGPLYTFGISDRKDFFTLWIALFGAIGIAFNIYYNWKVRNKIKKWWSKYRRYSIYIIYLICIALFLTPIIIDFGTNNHFASNFLAKKFGFINKDDLTKDFYTFWIALWGVIGIVINIIHSQIRIQNQDKQIDLQSKSQRDSRFSKGIELLGNGNESARAGAAYSLHFLAKDYPEEFSKPVFDILCSHIRTLTTSEDYLKRHPTVSNEVQTILNLLFKTTDENSTPVFPLYIANLIGANLIGANLKGANLERSHLERAHLKGANLEETHLEGANLEETHLERAHLERAHLERAHLEEAHLEEAHLEEAHLEEAHLERTYLYRVHLEEAHLEEAHLEKANLKEAHLYRVHLEEAHLERAHLEWAHLYRAHLERVHLERAHLYRAHLKWAYLKGAHLEKAFISSSIRSYLEKWELDLSSVNWVDDKT